MCGDLQPWEKGREITVRVTSGTRQRIQLPTTFDDVTEIRLDQFQITNFDGGTSGSCYLRITADGLHPGTVNNENMTGILLMVDVLTPQTVFNRPRVIGLAGGNYSFNEFQIEIVKPDGTILTLDEACFVITVVMRKPKTEMLQYRQLEQMTKWPQMKGPDPPVQFDPKIWQ